MGIGYVIDHCIAYFNKEQKEKAYKTYITDTLRLMTENTAKQAGGSYIKARYIEIVDPPKEETRTAEEVIDRIKTKLARL